MAELHAVRGDEIMRFTAKNDTGLPDWIVDMIDLKGDVSLLFEDDELHFTLWGPGDHEFRTVWFNEWLVRDPDGTVYPVSDEVYQVMAPALQAM